MARRHEKSRVLWRKYYARVPTREAVMDDVVSSCLKPTDVLLDAGSGSTLALAREYGPRVSFAVGVDLVGPSSKPTGRIGVAIGDLGALPIRDGAFDVIVSRSVVEHLEDPVAVFTELGRVLKPRGRLIFTTPNRYYYSSIVAGLIPYSWKDYYMHRVFGGGAYDHFPVFYRANTRRELERVAGRAGLRVARVEAIRHFPYYLLFSPVLFRLGMLYDWIVTGLKLDALQSTWLVVMERS
jgi:SAM-dependent methyltransferase